MSSTGRYWYWEVLVGHVHYVLAQVLVALVAEVPALSVSAHLPTNSPTSTRSPYFLELSRTSTATMSAFSHFPMPSLSYLHYFLVLCQLFVQFLKHSQLLLLFSNVLCDFYVSLTFTFLFSFSQYFKESLFFPNGIDTQQDDWALIKR